MSITTHVDGVYAIEYNGTQNLQNLANKYGLNSKDLLFNADREDDTKEGTTNALEVGDVIILSLDKVKTIKQHEEEEGYKKDLEKAEAQRQKHNKTHLTAATGAVAAGLGAWIGYTICKSATIGGMTGGVIGGVIGAAIGVGIAIYEYNVYKNNQTRKELEEKVNNLNN